MKITRWATRRANPISWVTTIMVMPLLARSVMTSSTSLIISGSSAEDDDVTILDALERVHAPDERALARAGRAAHDDDLAGRHPERDVAQDVELAEPLVDLPELDRRRHQAAASSPKSRVATRAGSRTSSASFDSERSTAVAMASGPPTAASVPRGVNLTRRLDVPGGSPAQWTLMSP